MFELTTPYGKRYIIHDNANIERTDLKGFIPSGQWKMLGLSHVKKRDFIPFSALERSILAGLPLTYKNGSPMWTVRDLDHGSIREWGNTKYHGVKRITIIHKRHEANN